jgi:uncharacterized RDD family membrane protein YckC
VDFAIWVPVLILRHTAERLSIPIAMVLVVVMLAFSIAYHVYFLSRWGQTPGKMAAGIKVVSRNGAAITQRQAWLRSSVGIGLGVINSVAVLHVLATWTGPEWWSLTWTARGAELAKRSSVFPVTDRASDIWMWSELVVMLFNKKRRALHDFIAGTVVITILPSESRGSKGRRRAR